MSKCSAVILTLEHGVRAVRLANSQVAVTVLPDKGADIYAFTHRASGIDVLWKSPQGLRAPNQGYFAADSQTAWLEMYEGGWQECLPNGGDPVIYRGVELSFHGESSLSPWNFDIAAQNDDEVIVDFSVQLYRTPFFVQRRMRLSADSGALFLSEKVTNLAGEALDFMWGHHPAFGAPFLSEHARIHTNAQTILVDGLYDAPVVRLKPDARSAWPYAPAKDGGSVDLSVIPGQNQKTMTMAYLLDFDGAPWYALTNAQQNLGVGCAWSGDVFRCLWMWQEMYASGGFPFYNRTYTMALEPWSSYPGHGLLEVMDTTKTHHTLQPRASLSAELTMTLFELDGSGKVRGVGLDGSVIQAG